MNQPQEQLHHCPNNRDHFASTNTRTAPWAHCPTCDCHIQLSSISYATNKVMYIVTIDLLREWDACYFQPFAPCDSATPCNVCEIERKAKAAQGKILDWIKESDGREIIEIMNNVDIPLDDRYWVLLCQIQEECLYMGSIEYNHARSDIYAQTRYNRVADIMRLLGYTEEVSAQVVELFKP